MSIKRPGRVCRKVDIRHAKNAHSPAKFPPGICAIGSDLMRNSRIARQTRHFYCETLYVSCAMERPVSIFATPRHVDPCLAPGRGRRQGTLRAQLPEIDHERRGAVAVLC